jgi:hypothetical protein
MKLLKDTSGQGLTEYLILMMLVCVISITAVTGLGKVVRDKIKEAESQISKISDDPNAPSNSGGNSGGQ